MSIVARVDRYQRKHPVVGFPIAVVYKFFDDQGPYLAAIMTYYAFIAIFPLMLIATSVLGFVLQDDLDLQQDLLDTALGQFPIVGDQLGRPEGLTGSTTAIVVGTVAALYGALGVGQSTQNAGNVAWGVPRNSRPNPIVMRLRSVVVLSIGGLGIGVIAVVQSIVDNPQVVGIDHLPDLGLLVRFVGLLVSWGIFITVFKLVSLRRASWRSVLPGSLFCALGWQLLQYVGDAYVQRVIVRASSMNQTFALVLGLIALLFLLTSIIVIGLEINVVRRRRLYPRALLTPFTDNVVLTEGDRRAYAQYARMQRHKGFQTISVDFDSDDDTEP
ncbi:YihY/virulence factor BrkB family protein [Aeromicrobium senzhongii]|uniref:YihY/virulence factor BrkB family protein n=1 Tax=Aeromicrobium senzhongii TaxID=2663859 RepID=A0ABX6SRK1_9ACTN|nr:YihY/virulence factor BrkB family protein [Aeromicrobium senzhongii]MTB88681.1 ribonuclease BN [Aeromicrobium senzhongii]QNL94019.1 YihY/virulence factor BrkB family protein [Aeromicrobium senzhongii]